MPYLLYDRDHQNTRNQSRPKDTMDWSRGIPGLSSINSCNQITKLQSPPRQVRKSTLSAYSSGIAQFTHKRMVSKHYCFLGQYRGGNFRTYDKKYRPRRKTVSHR